MPVFALRYAPALIASLILALAPGCAFSFLPRREHRAVPIECPHVVHRVAPRDPDIPRGIQRFAGEYCPPEPDGAFWCLFLVYGIVYVGYAIGWCIVQLAELIGDAIASDAIEEEDEIEAEQ